MSFVFICLFLRKMDHSMQKWITGYIRESLQLRRRKFKKLNKSLSVKFLNLINSMISISLFNDYSLCTGNVFIQPKITKFYRHLIFGCGLLSEGAIILSLPPLPLLALLGRFSNADADHQSLFRYSPSFAL